MAIFSYRAKKISGEEIKGEREARDKFDLAKQLRQHGYILVFCKEKTRAHKKFSASSLLDFLTPISLEEKMIFCRNLSVMVGAGMSLAKSLDILSHQAKSKKFQNVLSKLADGIRKGLSFSDTLKQYPKIFSLLFVAMVKAGETSGKLEEALKLTAVQLERDYELRRRVRGAMIYPAIVVIAMIIIAIAMLFLVVPTLTATFEELGVELPMATRVVITGSNFVINHGIFAGSIVLVLAALFTWCFRQPFGKNILDMFFIRAPLISPLVKKINSARATRTLASLIGSGVEIVEALNVTKDVLQNHYYKDVLEKAKEEIQKGSPISQVFIDQPHLFPGLVGEMIAVGEETGRLSDMLLRLATFYEEEVTEATKNLSTIIEPILMIVIGAGVGFFAVAMLSPMYSMVEGL